MTKIITSRNIHLPSYLVTIFCLLFCGGKQPRKFLFNVAYLRPVFMNRIYQFQGCWANLNRHFTFQSLTLSEVPNTHLIDLGKMNDWMKHNNKFRDVLRFMFKSELSKFCGRQPLKNLKGYGLLKQISWKTAFKKCT